MTLSQVYADAGVNHGYLSQLPKTGWRQDKLLAIARSLDWSVDELMQGALPMPAIAEPSPERKTAPAVQNGDLLELSIEIAVDLLRSMHTDPTAPKVGRLSRMILESLQAHVGSDEGLPSERSLRIWGRLLIAALRTPPTSS
jgi:hypothetical protein